MRRLLTLCGLLLAARIAVAECRKALAKDPALRRVLLVAFDESMAAVLKQAAAVS